MANTIAFSCGQDELGIYIRFGVDGGIYSDTAILKTAYWFTDQYYLFINKQKENNQYEIEIRPKEDVSPDVLKKVYGAFHNYLLDQETRQKVIQETAVIRDTLVKKAFFEAKTSLPKAAASTESHIPRPDESYTDDPVYIEKGLS